MDLKVALLEVKYRLGYPTVAVFTQDTVIEHFLKRAITDLSNKAFKETMVQLEPKPYYQFNPELVAYVVDVIPYDPAKISSRDVYNADEFTLAELQLFSQGDISSPLSILRFKEQFKYWLGNNFDWHYDQTSGRLYLTGTPESATSICVFTKEYFNASNLPSYMDDWVISRALAYTKQSEGKIRSKYSETIPGAPTDGDTLVQEGNEELQKSDESIGQFVSYDFGYRW